MRRLAPGLLGIVVAAIAVSSCGPGSGSPSLTDDAATTSEDESVTIDVLANDSNVGGKSPSIAASPSSGSATVEGRKITYEPAKNSHGFDSFEYSVGGEATAAVSVTIESVNDAPVAKPDSASTEQGKSVTIGVLANDSDPDRGATLRVESVTEPDHGSATPDGSGSVTYTPDDGFDGDDSFRYTVGDGQGAKADAEVAVEVSGKNDPPRANDDFAAVAEGKTRAIDVLANDTDPEDGELSLGIVSEPARGSATIAGDQLEVSAPSEHNDELRVEYRVEDPDGAAAKATLSIGVYEKLDAPEEAPVVDLPRQSIRANELAVVVNENDGYSKSVGATYAAERGIPGDHVVRVQLPTGRASVKPADFESVRKSVESAVDEDIHGYVLTWLEPYKVGCMSITSAFALGGYADKYCDTDPNRACTRTEAVDYYDSQTTRPWAEEQIRPAMMLALEKTAAGEELVRRGVKADHTFPGGTGYLIRTTDSARSSRWSDFRSTVREWDRSDGLDLNYIDNSGGSAKNVISNESNVLLYFTGLKRVDEIETNSYRPGAVADHLTSFGGRLSSFGGQMSAVEWLQAGATGSYGTVVEPCNYPQKFPRVSVLLEHYFRGNTLLEAYWKSVQWPGEGVFIGEPLASPWGRSFVRYEKGELEIRTTMLEPGVTYELVGRDELGGTASPVRRGISTSNPAMTTVTVDDPEPAHLTLRPAN